MCIYGESLKTYVVALIQPNRIALKELMASFGLSTEIPWPEICDNQQLNMALLKEVQDKCRSGGLMKYEIPVKIKICAEEWTPDNELVTSALKIRRKQIAVMYRKEIDEMYEEKVDSQPKSDSPVLNNNY